VKADRSPSAGLRFAGYASIFDKVDKGGDIVRPGAFKRTIRQGQHIPLLWQHQPKQVIGTIEHLLEDERGLQVIGSIRNDEFGRLLVRELHRGTLNGLSFGYRVASARQDGGRREIEDLDLLEVSLVRNPMQPFARVHKLAA
jgi:HK97 family phage prohead protease